MLRPAYKLTIGGKLVDTTDEPQASTMVDLNVALDVDTPSDSFTFVLGNVGSFRPAREDEVKVELGYADDGGLTQVMAGKVASVEPNLTTTRVIGYGGARALLGTYVEQTFESKKAGEIVSDLAGKASVDVATADDGIKFPFYVVDGRRSVYEHMRDLAGLCGFDLYLNADDELVFERFGNGKTVHVLELGKHIIALDVFRSRARAGKVEAWGESPASSQGEDAASWLTRDFISSHGEAGSGDLLLLERSALRTRDAARTAAQAALTEINRRTLRGRVVTIGRPEVKLGDSIRLSGMADDSLNAIFQVRSVAHRITKLGGFTTAVGFRAIRTDESGISLPGL
ncbi:MAG: phage late control D family protein [Blastocatellales bacterium]